MPGTFELEVYRPTQLGASLLNDNRMGDAFPEGDLD